MNFTFRIYVKRTTILCNLQQRSCHCPRREIFFVLHQTKQDNAFCTK